jgi:hypothetical protein
LSGAEHPRGRLLELADRVRSLPDSWTRWEPWDVAAAKELADLVWRQLTSQPVTLPDGTIPPAVGGQRTGRS